MFYVVQDSDGPFITEDMSVVERNDKILLETDDYSRAQIRLQQACDEWCGVYDDGPEEFWRDYA